jgi:hypothetical protein
MSERAEPDLDPVREALRRHDERTETDAEDAERDRPEEQPPDDHDEGGE